MEVLLSLLLIIFLSLLSLFVHEGGHAIAARACGRRLRLKALKRGVALIHSGGKPLSMGRQVFITAAGPGANIAVGIMVAVSVGLGPIAITQFVFGILNLFWPSKYADGYKIWHVITNRPQTIRKGQK